MVERRKTSRGRTLLGGSFTYGDTGFAVDCLIKNMSPNGAKLIFSDAIFVIGEVDLTIASHGKTRRSRLVWRRDKEAGIVFLEGEKKSGVEPLEQARERKPAQNDRKRLSMRIAQVTQRR